MLINTISFIARMPIKDIPLCDKTFKKPNALLVHIMKKPDRLDLIRPKIKRQELKKTTGDKNKTSLKKRKLDITHDF